MLLGAKFRHATYKLIHNILVLYLVRHALLAKKKFVSKIEKHDGQGCLRSELPGSECHF